MEKISGNKYLRFAADKYAAIASQKQCMVIASRDLYNLK